MSMKLSGLKIAILVANGFDEVDMSHAQRAFMSLGCAMKIISTENGLVNSWTGTSWGHHFPTDAGVASTLAADFDGLYVPGGSRSITKLRENAHVRRILRGFFDAGKPMVLMGDAATLLGAADRSADAALGFIVMPQSGDAENPVFAQLGDIFAQQPELIKAAA
jgi:protease I